MIVSPAMNSPSGSMICPFTCHRINSGPKLGALISFFNAGEATAETSCLSTRDSGKPFFSGALFRLFFLWLLRFVQLAFRGGWIVPAPVGSDRLVYSHPLCLRCAPIFLAFLYFPVRSID